MMHSHRSGLYFAEMARKLVALTDEDTVGNHAPLHFDLSTFDIYGAFAAGAELPGPAWLRQLVGDDWFMRVVRVDVAAISIMALLGLLSLVPGLEHVIDHDIDAGS